VLVLAIREGVFLVDAATMQSTKITLWLPCKPKQQQSQQQPLPTQLQHRTLLDAVLVCVACAPPLPPSAPPPPPPPPHYLLLHHTFPSFTSFPSSTSCPPPPHSYQVRDHQHPKAKSPPSHVVSRLLVFDIIRSFSYCTVPYCMPITPFLPSIPPLPSSPPPPPPSTVSKVRQCDYSPSVLG
jgi:hypothetical protein